MWCGIYIMYIYKLNIRKIHCTGHVNKNGQNIFKLF